MSFQREEMDAVLTVLFATMAFAWHSPDDLYFIPDHGQQIVQSDHHDVIHVECVDQNRMELLIQHLKTNGKYELPEEPPDWTFKWPAWMPKPTK